MFTAGANHSSLVHFLFFALFLIHQSLLSDNVGMSQQAQLGFLSAFVALKMGFLSGFSEKGG